MSVIIPSWCRIQCTSLGLVHINTGPCHVIWFYWCSYTSITNHHNVTPSLFGISRQFGVRYNPLLVLHTPHVTPFSLYLHWTLSCHMALCCSYTGICNQHNVSPSLFDISRQCEVRYMPFLVPHAPHVTRISIYKRPTLSCHMALMLFIYWYKSSS
jgi:hypothetical protein